MKTIKGLDSNGNTYIKEQTESENEVLERISKDKSNGILTAIVFFILFFFTFVVLMTKICPCK